ncbi:LysR family transcriptional regulator [Vibrio clamense]|uniref:LysR family transcriptional regulator n=1 Tax=Vibrio TaxID=662 RepID=UPI000DE96646|nr:MULTISPECIES: LysR family transcriptional regulator [Vibrio]MDN3698227.1 LysR family transcriptional regulator [Vibrio cortegadensis]RBW65251.1 LysR family transcriptional regulator [Vibrionales bacterium C3R12]TKF24227.1 LysR family transcriptional regulator [Vibrio genomosp. F6]
MTPYPNLPYSHKSLKVFEAVARLTSFTLAAKELHVTQSAVSRQIKLLEDEAKVSLIVRRHRSIELTLQGRELQVLLEKHYQSLESLIASWQHNKQKKIVIKAALSYATRSLIPKIQRLNEKYPDHEIVIIPSMEEDESLESTDYDLLIFNTRVGNRYKNRVDIQYLREEYMAPVCAQNLTTTQNDINAITTMPRLHPTLDHQDWKSWLKKSGHNDTRKVRNTTFFTLDLALSACLSGQGVTVTDLLLVLPELEREYLICPEHVQVQHSAWQYFCYSRSQSSIVDDLVEWIKAETEEELNRLNRLANKYGWNKSFK